MTTTAIRTPEEVEDDVMDALGSLNDAAQIEEICALANVVVAETMKGKKREMKKLLMKHLCTSDEDDDKLADFLAIHTHLKLGEQNVDEKEEESSESEDDTSKVKQEDEAAIEKSSEESKKREEKLAKKEKLEKSKKSGTKKSGTTPAERDEIEIKRVRVAKDFKLPGMIGGEGENALSYSSLEFEISKGRKLGFTDPEMCSTVISKTADKELKSYFENEKDMELDDVLEMLKGVCTVKESSTMFDEFTTDKQEPNEKPMTFITRVLRLRKAVSKKGKEEGIHYDKEMLAKRSFQVIFRGLRDENIRSALREQTRNDHNLPDKKVFAMAHNIISDEDERKKKLFPKKTTTEQKNTTEDVDVNAMDAGGNRDFSAHKKKEKRDPFVEIERLRNEMIQSQNEIKSLLVDFKKDYLTAGNGNERKPRKQANRCPNCVSENAPRCIGHCWQCGKSDHRMKDCPEN